MHSKGLSHLNVMHIKYLCVLDAQSVHTQILITAFDVFCLHCKIIKVLLNLIRCILSTAIKVMFCSIKRKTTTITGRNVYIYHYRNVGLKSLM